MKIVDNAGEMYDQLGSKVMIKFEASKSSSSCSSKALGLSRDSEEILLSEMRWTFKFINYVFLVGLHILELNSGEG